MIIVENPEKHCEFFMCQLRIHWLGYYKCFIPLKDHKFLVYLDFYSYFYQNLQKIVSYPWQ